MTNRKHIITIIFFLSIVFQKNLNAQSNDSLRTIKNDVFQVGEKLSFDIKYGFVTAGVSVMEVKDIQEISNRKVNHIVFQVNSVPSFDWIYKVRDRYETFIDVKGLFPWRFEQHIREGKYKRDYSAFFDQRNHKVFTNEGVYEIPEYVNDIISALYFARLFDYSKMKVDEEKKLKNFNKGKVYNLDVIFRGREEIEVPAGKFKAIIIEPIVRGGGLFKSTGRIYVWLSDDKLKIPIKVKSKIVIGSIDAVLTDYIGLKDSLTSKIID